jgi:hypothetical protein
MYNHHEIVQFVVQKWIEALAKKNMTQKVLRCLTFEALQQNLDLDLDLDLSLVVGKQPQLNNHTKHQWENEFDPFWVFLWNFVLPLRPHIPAQCNIR